MSTLDMVVVVAFVAVAALFVYGVVFWLIMDTWYNIKKPSGRKIIIHRLIVAALWPLWAPFYGLAFCIFVLPRRMWAHGARSFKASDTYARYIRPLLHKEASETA